MSRSLIFLSVVAVSTACGPELEGEGVETPVGQTQQELTTRGALFERGTFTSPVLDEGGGSPVYGCNSGLLGWHGEVVSIPLFGSIQKNVFSLSSAGSGTRSGKAELDFASVTIPYNGTYRLKGAEIWVKGSTHVSGDGWAFSSADARADVKLYLIPVLHKKSGGTIALTSFLPGRIAFDETKSENRTKTFSKQYTHPEIEFSAVAGDVFEMTVRLEMSVWSSSEGAANIRIKEFGAFTCNSDSDPGFSIEKQLAVAYY